MQLETKQRNPRYVMIIFIEKTNLPHQAATSRGRATGCRSDRPSQRPAQPGCPGHTRAPTIQQLINKSSYKKGLKKPAAGVTYLRLKLLICLRSEGRSWL